MMILASDFDGTIYINNRYNKEDLKAIRDFQGDGNLFGIITGRTYHILYDLIKDYIEPDFIIANNGAHIKVRENDIYKELLKETLDRDLVKTFMSKYMDNTLISGIRIFTDQSVYINIYEDIKKDEQIMALALYTELEIENTFYENLDFHYSMGVIDIINKGINKQTGIDIIRAYYDYKDEIIAIGDDRNDIAFLKATSKSYTLNRVKDKKVIEASNYKVKNIKELIDNLKEDR